MHVKSIVCLAICLALGVTGLCAERKSVPAKSVPAKQDASDSVPAMPREFRAAWVATVENIDWPSKRGLPTEQQQTELIKILDKAVQLHMNAIILQVRPCCDAIYASKLEPWSEYLTGTQGKAPDPYYDPLEFAVTEAHKRGLELHAWFNPYRAKHPSGKSALAVNHVSHTKPAIVRQYGAHLWLDPGEPLTQDHSLAVIMDVVRRYDIDGVHLDDYFYPYRESSHGKEIPFPDDHSYHVYQQSGGTLGRDDWRRENVNVFVQRLYKAVKGEKPWVKVGISPFGIWRPGNPAQVKGFDSYQEIYCDARKWLNQGWLDYLSPQLYWKIEQTGQSFPVLLSWWISQNTQGRHIWPGSYTSRVGEDGGKHPWPASEIIYQIKTTRGHAGATGNIQFSMKTLLLNNGGLADQMLRDVYTEPALIPASPWLSSAPPTRPEINIATKTEGDDGLTLQWQDDDGDHIWLWALQTRINGVWHTRILPREQAQARFAASQVKNVDQVALSAVDRYGNQSAPALLDVRRLIQTAEPIDTK
jgi:uncharacterized lipoprotein YddW (UPF0748 family)